MFMGGPRWVRGPEEAGRSRASSESQRPGGRVVRVGDDGELRFFPRRQGQVRERGRLTKRTIKHAKPSSARLLRESCLLRLVQRFAGFADQDVGGDPFETRGPWAGSSSPGRRDPLGRSDPPRRSLTLASSPDVNDAVADPTGSKSRPPFHPRQFDPSSICLTGSNRLGVAADVALIAVIYHGR